MNPCLSPVCSPLGTLWLPLAGGDEMKWRVLLEVTEADGVAVTHEVSTGGRPMATATPDTIGLTLSEGKSILAFGASPGRMVLRAASALPSLTSPATD